MDRKFSSIVEELANIIPSRDRELFVESRAQQVIASAINLINLIEENYDPETANELTRRLFNSIKGRDEQKFRRKIQQIRESRTRGPRL